jgi:hypothetical protein
LAVTRQNFSANANDTPTMTAALRQIVFINTAHPITH